MEVELLNNSNIVLAEAPDFTKEKDIVVVTTQIGEELARVRKKINKSDSEENKIQRTATDEDLRVHCENCKFTKSILPEIKKEAENLKLDMKIGFISANLDRTKIIVNYTADERVDFRDLIKILGSKYKSRIEMKQIGNRDESKKIGSLGVCGRETCCKAFLDDFDKVSIKMAKNQNISLNPTRINGMCGRLLCCLKYEDEFYSEMQKKMPKMNSVVSTPDGKGTVSALDFLREKVSVTFSKDESSEVKIYNLTDITIEKPKN